MLNQSDLIGSYIRMHSTPEDSLLARISRETHLRVLNPRMLSGPLQGKLIEFISRMIKPSYILEIGTYTGYSAICLARGLAPGGKLITIEKNEEIIHYPLKYFKEAGLDKHIELLHGDALKIIPTLPYSFDLVYIDGDKTEYIQYYQLTIGKINGGGFLLTDNVLWGGKVMEKPVRSDTETQTIVAFNQLVLDDARVENIILPLRDGINLIRKI
jgi:caffeoyl-CoA O-methyltransferase